MRRVRFGFLVAFSTLAMGVPAVAQPSAASTPAIFGSAGLSPSRRPDLQPYTVEFKIVNVQTLGDGTTIKRETKELTARDSQGRTLNLTTQQEPFAPGKMITRGEVHNPVDDTQISWDSQSTKATLIKLPPLDQRQGCWKSDSGHLTINYGGGVAASRKVHGHPILAVQSGSAPSPTEIQPQRTKPEDLGTATIAGIEVHGQRLTTVTPLGEIGNDRELVRVSETWMSPTLHLVLKQVRNDPRMGKMTREAVSVTLSEPDLSVFQPPEGYEVVTDEMHPFACSQ